MPSRPALFVGSSLEGISLARAVQEGLEQDAEATVWDQNVFEPSGVGLQSLVRQLGTSDFAAFVFTPDDELKMRGSEYATARDNVIFEIGLAIGELGQRRTFILVPRDRPELRIPSDLLGITYIPYDLDREDENIVAAVAPACNKMRRQIEALGTRSTQERPLSPLTQHQAIIQGVARISGAIGRAVGPKGALVNVEIAPGHRRPTRKGVLIARWTRSSDPYEEQVIELLRRAAISVESDFGDGTKIALLLACRLVQVGREAIDAGHSTTEVVAGMKAAVKIADNELVRLTHHDTSRLRDIARTASGSEAVADAVMSALTRAGNEGVVTVEESPTSGVHVEVTEGMMFDRGYMSAEFITDPSTRSVQLKNPRVLLYTGRIQSFREILPILEYLASQKESLLVIADEFGEEVLSTLILNKQKANLLSVAVRAPGFAERRVELLRDIAILTGAQLIDPLFGMTLQRATSENLGRAKAVKVEAQSTTIMEGAGSENALAERIASIQAEIAVTPSDYDREKLLERIANLRGRIVTIRVGGDATTPPDELREQVGAALHAATAASTDGFVVGGGVAFIHAKKAIQAERERDAARLYGMRAVAQALEQPARRLSESAGQDQATVLAMVERGEPNSVGLNVETGRGEDLMVSGVLDASKTIRGALAAALTQARMILMTEGWQTGGADTQA